MGHEGRGHQETAGVTPPPGANPTLLQGCTDRLGWGLFLYHAFSLVQAILLLELSVMPKGKP